MFFNLEKRQSTFFESTYLCINLNSVNAIFEDENILTRTCVALKKFIEDLMSANTFE